VVLVSGSSWSVDVPGTHALLREIDVDAGDFCNAAAEVESAGETLAAALKGSGTVRSALAGFLADRETVPSRITSRVRGSSGAVTTSVEAVVFADEDMSTATLGPVADTTTHFDAGRFSSTPGPK
jgi:hypothetical protein